VSVRNSGNGLGLAQPSYQSPASMESEVLQEDAFRQMISIERKRTERSRKPFLLMLLGTGGRYTSEKNERILSNVLSVMTASTRETDVVGWYKNQSTVGVMFTELAIDDRDSILSTILARVSNILRDHLTFEQFNEISISFHLFPDNWDDDNSERPSNPTLYPDLSHNDNSTRLSAVVKRMMDIIGSVLALVILAPVFMVITLAVKLSSEGSVFFKQQRVGQYGRNFTFLKFRSMQANNDPGVHKEYVTQLIAGQAQRHPSMLNGDEGGVYKLTNDSRVTRVGAFLRRTSLDELPQLINVLRGEMSLVGPRPAIPYEVAAYQTWHRRRVLEVKPGITGLWQVSGRCRLKFDEAVRLDLRYAKNWSPWLDVKILLRTPRAVWLGEGAY